MGISSVVLSKSINKVCSKRGITAIKYKDSPSLRSQQPYCWYPATIEREMKKKPQTPTKFKTPTTTKTNKKKTQTSPTNQSNKKITNPKTQTTQGEGG